jgi:cell division septal protein FtsQ
MSTDDAAKPITAPGSPPPAAGVGPAPAPRRRKRRAAAPPPPTARQALLAFGEELRASRKRARANGRVGWGLFRDDVRRGRIIDIAVLGLLAALAIAIATSPDYQVQSVNVVNSKAISSEQAARMTGILGMNIFLVDPGAVAERLRQSPLIKSASVETRLPGQVTIRVDERKPNVVWVLVDNTPYLISDDGIIISEATTLQGYIVVYDLDTAPGTLKLGDPLERQDVIDVAQQLFAKLPQASGLRISRMEYQVAGGVTVVTDQGRRVRFGDGQALDLKVREASALVKDLAGRNEGWRVIDAQAPERLAVSK